MIYRKRHKYRAIKTICHLGHKHPSKKEATYCDWLSTLKKNGDIFAFEYDVAIPLIVNEILICKYRIDFMIWPAAVSQPEYNEVKGYKTAVWKLKHKLFKALNPNSKYTVIE